VKKVFRVFIVFALIAVMSQITGCTALQKKFTRKKKKENKVRPHFMVREYDVKPSMALYEKHYVFWINWQREMLQKLGRNYKSDKKCIEEITGNLHDMAALLTDEKAGELLPHIETLGKVKVIVDKRNMTKASDTRIRQILEREYRSVKRDFSPGEVVGCIRKEFRVEGDESAETGGVEQWSE